jgi:hypothetical protein
MDMAVRTRALPVEVDGGGRFVMPAREFVPTYLATGEPGPYDDVSPLVSYFLIDRQGVVRWNHVVALDDPADYAQHPSGPQLLAAARAGVL